MMLKCPSCHRDLEFSGDRPSFCAFCGHALEQKNQESTIAYDRDAPTLPPSYLAASALGSVPEVVAGYRLLRPLGTGGMGTVYEAEDTTSGRHIALKLISAEFVASADAVDRFRQEGRLASRIVHPRCVFVLAADEYAGQPYIVMELMPGTTLHDLVRKRGPLPVEEAVVKIIDVIEA
jgi:eukaryotic-like serine/threonine-protein kinase